MDQRHIETRYVETGDGTRIAVYEEGRPDGPTVVLVHGWPDSHVLWDGVVPLLTDRFRVIRYDNRGAGASSAPKAPSSYRLDRLADDFAAVIADVSPADPVHVVGHDWGASTIWEYLSRPVASDRVASYTSISGPDPNHLARYVLDGLARPYRPKRFLRSLSQAAHLSYMIAFSLPVIMPALMRAFLARVVRNLFIFPGIPVGRRHQGDTFVADAAVGLKIYQANYFRSVARVEPDRFVSVPVQLLVNTGDPFVRPYLFDDTAKWAPRLWRRDIRAGHWSPMSHPQVVATAVAELADYLETGRANRALLRAQVGRPRKDFGDTLVSVTGAGSGIGRQTALAFAREGAEVIVSDIDEATAKETAGLIVSLGGTAHPYVLDVADPDAVERFAADICATHGVPDVVVNNAGIGAAGAFLNTPVERFDRVLDVNLGGVVNCCRAFAGRMVDRGTGGHIVNVASMAAYTPLSSLSAYCTSKAAVYMFSDCLRAELAAAGVGLTTICPGVVDTNIVATTPLYAPAGSEKAVPARQAQLVKMFNVRRYGPDRVAAAILSAVKKNKAIRPVAPEAYLLYGTSRMLPQVLRSTARGRVL
jgi:NAD(P)-dependent dehydrogenase (short-subunit alcohol dehydrogenase family)/pimeloyl-ACP methyl ester carboxylesterase